MSLKFQSSEKLRELINEVDWVSLSSGVGGKKSPILPTEVAIKYVVPILAGKKTRVVIKFGSDVMEHLGWKIGKKLLISFDPNNINYFIFIESLNGVRKIKKDGIGNTCSVSFLWPHMIGLSDIKRFIPIKFDLFQGHLGLKIE